MKMLGIIPVTLQSFSSDNHALVALSMFLVATLCVALFLAAPLLVKFCVFLISITVIFGSLFIAFDSSVAQSNGPESAKEKDIDQADVKLNIYAEHNTTCVLIENGKTLCWSATFSPNLSR